MRFKNSIIFALFLIVGVCLVSVAAGAVETDNAKIITANLTKLQSLQSVTNNTKQPELKNPEWLQQEIDAEVAAKAAAARAAAIIAEQRFSRTINSTLTYDVSTRGSIVADIDEFKTLANQTLNDNRGWSRLGANFQEVASGGDFTLVISEASQVPSFSYICSASWSCRVGRYVIINQDRWLYASDAWNSSGGSLRDYRNMVINHETGHWLGHYDDNAHCGGSGQSAPVMQQQSINLLGCSFNPWPLNFEIWSNKL
jgi:hypothetical protein